MKKTFTLLFAAAGVAIGATNVTEQLIWNADKTVADLTGITFSNNDVSVVITLNWNKITDAKYQDIFTICDKDSTHKLGVGMFDNDEINLIYTNKGDEGYISYTGAFADVDKDSTGEVQSAAFVFTGTLIGPKQMTINGYLYLWEGTNTSPRLVTVTSNREVSMTYNNLTLSNGLTDKIEVYTGVVDNPEELASALLIKDDNIPEPTTATLGLLALAGLAARRRRH